MFLTIITTHTTVALQVSSELFKYRNKRVPEVGELKDLHELVDRIHHSLGYLMVLGQQPSVANAESFHVSDSVVKTIKS